MKPYLSHSCSNPVIQRTLSNWNLVWLGGSWTGLLMVGNGVAAEVDGSLRLCEGAASLGWKKFRPELPPSLVRLLDTKRLRICDKLIKFITTQDLLYPRTVSETLTENTLYFIPYLVTLASAGNKTLSIDGTGMLSSLISGSSRWIWRSPRSWSPITLT